MVYNSFAGEQVATALASPGWSGSAHTVPLLQARQAGLGDEKLRKSQPAGDGKVLVVLQMPSAHKSCNTLKKGSQQKCCYQQSAPNTSYERRKSAGFLSALDLHRLRNTYSLNSELNSMAANISSRFQPLQTHLIAGSLRKMKDEMLCCLTAFMTPPHQ